jgi:RNA polymerase sigma factor (sigma-70 family)
MRGLIAGGGTAELESKLLYLARRQFRIPRDVAADLVQSSLLVFLEVQHRYPRIEEHPQILVGIFRNKCREHIERSVRAARALNGLKASAESGDPTIAAVRARNRSNGGVLGEVVRQEDGRRVIRAIESLRAPARELFRLITEEGLSRQELIRRLGTNPNTLDSKLHAYRKELRRILRRDGLEA